MIEHDPVNGPYCGFVPTANTSLHNISMGTMQTLMGLNVGASIAQREAQAQMDYLEVMALNNANQAQNQYQNGLNQGYQRGYQAALAEINALKAQLKQLSEYYTEVNEHCDRWESRHNHMYKNALILAEVLAKNKIPKPPLYRYSPELDSHIKS